MERMLIQTHEYNYSFLQGKPVKLLLLFAFSLHVNISGRHSEIYIFRWIHSGPKQYLFLKLNFLQKKKKEFTVSKCRGLNFFLGFNFTTAEVVCVTAVINHKFISFSAVQIYDLSFIHLHPSLLRVYYELAKWPAPRWLDSSVGRALHRYRRGHGFESCSNFKGLWWREEFHLFWCLGKWFNCFDETFAPKWFPRFPSQVLVNRRQIAVLQPAFGSYRVAWIDHSSQVDLIYWVSKKGKRIKWKLKKSRHRSQMQVWN